MKKVLFLIHDLGPGGAEKVLVNLINNMDTKHFDITVMALFGGGVNEQFIKKDIRLIICHKKAFPGNTHVMKLFSPKQLYRFYIKEHYDIVISYLEGPSARIASGCWDPNTKLVTWIHCTMRSQKELVKSFRSVKEAISCYTRFNNRIFVSEDVMKAFKKVSHIDGSCQVLYNTNDTNKILLESCEEIDYDIFNSSKFNICGMGKLTANKGFDRLLRVHSKLVHEGYAVHIYVIGEGEERAALTQYIEENSLSDSVTLLGYQTNPYKFISHCDLYVCASHYEGFSTAATEALIVGTPVCSVEVSGMKEMLGDNNEWGIVTENNEEALYEGIKFLLDDTTVLKNYKEKAIQRGKTFSTENTVRAVEDMLETL